MLNAEFMRREITDKKNRLNGLVNEVVNAIDNAVDSNNFFVDLSNDELSVVVDKRILNILEDANVLNAFDSFMKEKRSISYVYRYDAGEDSEGNKLGKIIFKEYDASNTDPDDITF